MPARYGDQERIEQFWARIVIGAPEDCWEWQAGRSRPGWYGRVSWEGGRLEVTHRVAWMLAYGPIPDGQLVLHRCDNPPCCNPGHLFLGTHGDNNADMDAKGRRIFPAADTNRAKTHCPQGHEFTPENIYVEVYKDGRGRGWARHCRACRSQAMRDFYERQRQRGAVG